MSRFYQTAKPEFVDDFIYQPPWKLMQEVMATKQQGYDDALQSSELFKNMLNINHLGFEDEKAREIKDYWNSKVDNVVNELKSNPGSYNKVMPMIRDLGRELDTDRREGNIAKIEGRYNAWNQWQKDNADIQKSDPGNYNSLANYWYSDLMNKTASNFNSEFKGAKGILKPDVNSKEIREALKEFKSNSYEKSNGKYKVGEEYVTEAEAERAFLNLYMSDPNTSSYVKQQVMLKDPRYFDDVSGQARELFVKDSTGALVVNPLHGFSSGINAWGDILSFNKQKLTEDDYGKISATGAQTRLTNSQQNAYDWKKTQYKEQQAFNRDRANWGDKSAYLLQEYALKQGQAKNDAFTKLEIDALKGDEASAKALQALTLQANPFDVKNPTVDYTSNLSKVRSGDTKALELERKARDFARSSDLNLSDPNFISKFWRGDARDLKEVQNYKSDFLKAYDLGISKGQNIDTIIKNYKAQDEKSGGKMGRSNASTISDAAFKELANKYVERKQEWFDDVYSNTSVQKSFEPLTTKGQIELLNLVSNNTSAWDIRNPDGSKADNVNISKITRATNGSGQGMMGYQGEDDKGNTVMIFPNQLNSATTNIAQSITVDNLKNPNTYLRTSLTNSEVNRLDYMLNSTGSYQDNTKGLIFNSSAGDIPVRSSAGRLYIMDPNTNKPIRNAPDGFSNSAELVNYLRN